ncbi:MAG TPA: peptide deformylase [Gammaproteobacteria bacterium]|jgi:peptide deformylase|nr:peptide deformylase [Gammaproteobacteria bacterium]
MLASGSDLHAMHTELPPLVTLGNPRLAQPSMPVAVNQIVNDDFQSRLRTLRLGLEHHGANGIAAPQLGWFERYLLMRDPSNGGDLIYWINPQLKVLSADLVWYWEGCLSVPGIKAYVGRPSAVSVAGFDENGTAIERCFDAWEAHLFQHEFDHLDGILFPYRVADPRHMVSATEFEQRGDWPEDWPLPGAKHAPVRIVND